MQRMNWILCAFTMILTGCASATAILLPRTDLGGGHLTAIENIHWSSDSELLVTNDRIDVRVWRARDLKLLRVLKASELKAAQRFPRSAMLSNRDELSVVGFVGRDRICLGLGWSWFVFEWRSGKVVANLSKARLLSAPNRLIFENANGWKALSFPDGQWRSGRNQLPRGATYFSHDMQRAAVPTENSFEIWDVPKEKLLCVLRDSEKSATDKQAFGPVVFSRDNKHVFAPGFYDHYEERITEDQLNSYNIHIEDRPLMMWDAMRGKNLRALSAYGITKIQLSEDEKTLFFTDYLSGFFSMRLHLVDVPNWKEIPFSAPLAKFSEQYFWQRHAELSPNGQYLANAVFDSNPGEVEIAVWRLTKNSQVLAGNLVSKRDGSAKDLENSRTNLPPAPLKNWPTQDVDRISAFSASGELALLQKDATVTLYRVKNHQQLHAWRADFLLPFGWAYGDEAMKIQSRFAPDDKTITIRAAGYLYVCDTQTGHVKEILKVRATPDN